MNKSIDKQFGKERESRKVWQLCTEMKSILWAKNILYSFDDFRTQITYTLSQKLYKSAKCAQIWALNIWRNRLEKANQRRTKCQK